MAEIVFDKKHTGDEYLDREIAFPDDKLTGSHPKSMKESDNMEGKSSSKFGTECLDLPTLTETVLNMFTVYADQMSENDDIRHETEDLTILSGSKSMPNKPVAIVKPCQNLKL